MLQKVIRAIARRCRDALARLRRKRAPEAVKPDYPLHGLENNFRLTDAEYARCVAVVGQIQALYDGALPYLDAKGLDKSLFMPGNEWKLIVPETGLRFSTGFNDTNYLRLNTPFAGFHMPILDRLDGGRRFEGKENEEFVNLVSQGCPDDIADQMRQQFDPRERLAHVIPEFFDHIHGVPARYIVRTPRLFGEIGLDIHGVLVNPDTILCQSRINGLLCSGVIGKIERDIARRGRARVVEIGAGYGGLAYALWRLFGEKLEYVLIDLPSSLHHSSRYLTTLAGGRGCHVAMPEGPVPDTFNFLFVANYLVDELAPTLGPVDLALNAMSFPEMSETQVRYYGNMIKSWIGDDGCLFEENGVVHPWHTDNKKIFNEIFAYHKHVESRTLLTKNWCQDIWTNRYIGDIHDCSDAMFLNA